MHNINHNESNILKTFGIKIEKNFLNIDSRILDPPTIVYQNCSVTPSRGSWMDGRMASTFIVPENLKNWAILVIGRGNIRDFGNQVLLLLRLFIFMFLVNNLLTFSIDYPFEC